MLNMESSPINISDEEKQRENAHNVDLYACRHEEGELVYLNNKPRIECTFLLRDVDEATQPSSSSSALLLLLCVTLASRRAAAGVGVASAAGEKLAQLPSSNQPSWEDISGEATAKAGALTLVGSPRIL